MTAQDPTRLFDPSSGADARVRRCLDAGRDELPTEEQLAALAARLGPLFGPGGSTPPPTGGTPGGGVAPTGGVAGGLFGKALVVAAVASVLAGGGLWWRARQATAPPEAIVAAPVALPDAAAPPPAPAIPPGLDPPEAPSDAPPTTKALATPTKTRVAPAARDAGAADAAAPPVDPDAELALVRAAQDALRTGAAARALALANDHAQRFSGGVLAQEREVVAIDALAHLGRAAEARARAEAFRRHWPRSAHVRRLDVILGPAAPPAP